MENMTKIKTMFWAIGKNYEYNNDQINISEGLLSKEIDTINFVDIKDITSKVSLFGWGTITITDINGTKDMHLVSHAKDIHQKLNAIFLDHKNKMKKVDLT